MSILSAPFGKTPDGTPVELYTLTHPKGMNVKITTYGGRITELQVPDRNGKLANVVLGFDNLNDYVKDSAYLGATVGRYANRIAKGRFSIDGVEYRLATNNAPNALHGGPLGFHAVVWKAEPAGECTLRLTYLSKDGEEGYPGNLRAAITFALSEPGELRVDYEATSDKPTPINLTNHSYFNLAGADSPSVLEHTLALRADRYTPMDDTLIPTGEIASVRGTPLDFTDVDKPHTIGERAAEMKVYDHNFVLNSSGKLAQAAIVRDPSSGRTMELLTTQPGVQLYTGRKGAFCLETQHFPDSPNRPAFPDTILRPGKTYRETAIFRFSST